MNENERVFVYWNLHKNVWSVRSCKTRKVIKHCKEIILKDCKFSVSEAGRQRVLREKRKNVHAGVVGTLAQEIPVGSLGHFRNLVGSRHVRYNPYQGPTFVYGDQAEPIMGAKTVIMHGDRSVYASI